MKKEYYGFDDNDTNLLWDLRQFYAMYVSKYLIRFDEFREMKDYQSMLNQLKWLFSTVKTRIKKNYTEEEYKEDLDKLLKISNKYRYAWNGLKMTSEGTTEIEESFRTLYEGLMHGMVKGGIFGKEEDLSGL